MPGNPITPYLKTSLTTYFPWLSDTDRYVIVQPHPRERRLVILDLKTEMVYEYIRSIWDSNTLQCYDTTHASYSAFIKNYFTTEKDN